MSRLVQTEEWKQDLERNVFEPNFMKGEETRPYLKAQTDQFRTPPAIVNQISVEVARILKLPEIHERISREGTTPRTSTPAEFTKMVHEEIAKRKKVFKAAGTKAD